MSLAKRSKSVPPPAGRENGIQCALSTTGHLLPSIERAALSRPPPLPLQPPLPLLGLSTSSPNYWFLPFSADQRKQLGDDP